MLPGPLTANRTPGRRSPREEFDAVVLAVVRDLETRWSAELGLVEFAVEETPMVPDDWAAESVPLGSTVRGSGVKPSRLVLFRRPIELRSQSREDLVALVFTVLVEQVAELLGCRPDEVHPRYDEG